MLHFDPPLLNSSNVWATTQEELKRLYHCPYTGAVTTRTSLLNGFRHNDEIHQYRFVNVESMNVIQRSTDTGSEHGALAEKSSSLNTLGYSPVPLMDYINIIKEIEDEGCETAAFAKPVIFSVTGSAEEIVQSYLLLQSHAESRSSNWLMEINLSCPNIHNKPPPAYSRSELTAYLRALSELQNQSTTAALRIGIKTPPYTYQSQFDDLMASLNESATKSHPCPVAFITATNTLGSCLILDPISQNPALCSVNGSGVGGLAGTALHPLALGNVRTIRRMLDLHENLKKIEIIGVGGVSDADGFQRMKSIGAAAVAVGTAFGLHGVDIFEKISKEAQIV